MSSMKDTKKLLTIAKQHGWSTERRKKKWRCTSPEGVAVVVDLTPSHTRNYANTLARFKRGGMEL